MKKILILLITGAILATASSCQHVSAGNTTISESSLSEVLPTSSEETTETAIVTETTKAATPTPTEKPTETPTTLPETSATTVATTTAAPTAKPTKVPTQTTSPVATTKATEPAPTTTKATTPRYQENPDVIREGIIQYCKDQGLWFPGEEVNADGEMSAQLGFLSSDQRYIDAFVQAKITGIREIVSVSCWIADGWIHIKIEESYFPTPAPIEAPPPETTPAPPPADTPTPSP